MEMQGANKNQTGKELDMTIGQRIKKARLHNGLTQQELGMLIGFPLNSTDVRIAQYESSARKPKADIKEKLSKVLKINLRYLYMTENNNCRTRNNTAIS